MDVYNSGSTNGLAADVSHDLSAMGYRAGTVADSSTQPQQAQAGTQVFYGAGSAAAATRSRPAGTGIS